VLGTAVSGEAISAIPSGAMSIRVLAHGSGNRLLLRALVKGLGEAIRRNDQSAAERYRGRIRSAAEQIAADDPVRDALGRLLLISGLWIAAAAVDRDGRLRRFLPPQVADLIVASGTEKQLESHRREITEITIRYSCTLRYAGDGVMVVFDDPTPVDDAAIQAVQMA
jgi:hypothetical protein